VEELIAAQFRLEGEDVIRISTGMVVSPAPNKAGYSYASYRVTRGKHKRILLHRLKFFLAHGYLPQEVDHRDRHSVNSELTNLRAATSSQNKMNRAIKSRPLPRCVYETAEGRYVAKCRLLGERHHLGHYDTPREASEAVERFRQKHHGEFYAKP
jgi:hypothetical protein